MRLKILLHHESTNISYSYKVLYNFPTPFSTFSQLVLANTRGAVGNLIFLGTIDKKPRVKAAECFARIPQEKGFCFWVTALPTRPPHPSMCLHKWQWGCKFKDLHPYVTDEDIGGRTPQEPASPCAYPGLVESQGRPPALRPSASLLLCFLCTHHSESSFPREQWYVWKESFVFLYLEVNIEPENHLCSFPVFVPMP